MTKRKKRERVYYSAAEKECLLALVDVHGYSYAEAVAVMTRKFGRAPSRNGATKMLWVIRKEGKVRENLFSYSAEMRERIVNLARSGNYRSAREIERAVEAGGEKPPRHYTITLWCKKAGIKLYSTKQKGFRQYTDEARREFLRLYVTNLPIATILQAVARMCGGNVPSRRWGQLVAKEAGVTRPKNASRRHVLKVVPPALCGEPDGDSWQAAWDAAEGLDGAAWTHAVLKSWLPDYSHKNADGIKEERSTRRRKAAQGRRLAA